MKEVLKVVCSGIGGVVLTLVFQFFFPTKVTLSVFLDGENVKVTQSEYVELVEENKELNSKLSELMSVYQDLETEKIELSDKNAELLKLVEDAKTLPQVEYKNMKVVFNNSELDINSNSTLAVINGNNYILDDVVKDITKKNIEYDDNIIIIGDSTILEYTDLNKTLTPYKSKFFEEASNITIAGKTHKGYMVYNSSYAFFNLNGEYSSLIFDFAALDEVYDTSIGANLFVYIDGVEQSVCTVMANEMPKHFEVDVSGANQLQFDLGYTKGSMTAFRFGLINVKIK